MNAIELSEKLYYTGQVRDAMRILHETSRFTMEELSNMSKTQLCEELLKDYVVVSQSQHGDEILLIKKERVDAFWDMAEWLIG